MKPKEIFDIIVRTAGLLIALYGLSYLLGGILSAMGLYESRYQRYAAIFGVVQVIAGLMMMRGLIPLADIAYPSEDASPRNSPAPTTRPGSGA